MEVLTVFIQREKLLWVRHRGNFERKKSRAGGFERATAVQVSVVAYLAEMLPSAFFVLAKCYSCGFKSGCAALLFFFSK